MLIEHRALCLYNKLFCVVAAVKVSAAELFKIGVDKAVNVAVHNRLNIAGFKAGAVILNKGVGHENIGADLAAPCDLTLLALDIVDLVEMLSLFDLNEL